MKRRRFGAQTPLHQSARGTNGQVFKAWVEQHLVRELTAGDIVVMDNLSSHKVSGVVDAIAAVGASVRYLPPYSPDLNPIELAFSKFKKAAPRRSRTHDGQTVDSVRPSARSVPRIRMPQLPEPLRLPLHLNRRRTSRSWEALLRRVHRVGVPVPACAEW